MGDLTVWIKGLVSAGIGGGANVVTTMVVAPEEFNLDTGLPKVAAAAGIGALIAVANFLKQSPLPGEKK